MASVNFQHGWIYLFEPHTASRATELALNKYVGGAKIGHHHIGGVELTARGRQHISPKEYHNMVKLASVRNPFDLAITKWLVGEFSRMPFGEYITQHLHSEYVRKPAKGLCDEADIICRYELLEGDLSYVFGTEVKLKQNPKHKTKNKRSWWSYYDRETFEKCKEVFTPFMKKYGYRAEWYGTTPSVLIDHSRTEVIRPTLFEVKRRKFRQNS